MVVGAGTGAVGELLCCRGYFGLLYSSCCNKVGGGGRGVRGVVLLG